MILSTETIANESLSEENPLAFTQVSVNSILSLRDNIANTAEVSRRACYDSRDRGARGASL